MRVLPLFVFVALSFRPALAQSKAVATPIRYSRELPKSVAQLMPRGARSLFWGTFRPTQKGALMGVHLLALRPKKDLTKNTEVEATYHFALDVFASQRQRWHRLNRVPVVYQASIWGPVTVNTRLYWLNQSEKTAPIVVFDVMTPKGTPTFMGSPVGDGVFVTFPQGWAKPAQVENFEFGSSSDGNHSYQVEVNANGQLQVETDFNEPSGTTKMVYQWNGHEFLSSPEATTVVPLQP